MLGKHPFKTTPQMTVISIAFEIMAANRLNYFGKRM